MIDNDNFKSLTLQDMTNMWWREQKRLGKIKSTLTMSLVDGEWVFNYDGKATRFVDGKWVVDNSKGKKSLVERKITQTKEIPIRQWFSLKKACELKGINFKTACNKSYLKPNCGEPDGIIAGRKSWKLETIIEWIQQTDQELMNIYKSRKK